MHDDQTHGTRRDLPALARLDLSRRRSLRRLGLLGLPRPGCGGGGAATDTSCAASATTATASKAAGHAAAPQAGVAPGP